MNPNNSASSASYFEMATGKSANTLWCLRGFAAAAIVNLLLALFVWKSGGAHGLCLGFAVGMLIGVLVQLSAVTHIETNADQQRSDVEVLPLTH